MFTDPAEIRREIGWGPATVAQVAVLLGIAQPKALELLTILQPTALYERGAWWDCEGGDIMATWTNEQDRTGLDISPSVEVPPGKAECKVTLNATGFTNEAQVVELEIYASYNGAVTWQPESGGQFIGGEVPLKKDGTPGERSITFVFGQAYPTHLQVRLTIPGVVNCGLGVDFFDPTP